MWIKCLFLYIFFNFGQSQKPNCETNEARNTRLEHLNGILSGYNPHLPPKDGPIEVKVEFEVYRLLDYHIYKHTLNFEAFFGIFWTDPRLDLSRLPCFSNSSFSSKLIHRIWSPNLRFYDIIGSNEDNGPRNAQLYILEKGTIHLLQKVALSAPCYANIKNNTLVCSVDLGSDEHHSGIMKLDFLNFHKGIPMQGFADKSLEEIAYERLNENYLGMDFDLLRVHLRFDLRNGNKIKYYYLPIYALVILSWIAFFLNKNVTSRVLLGLSILFAIYVLHYIFVISELAKIPHGSWVDIFIFINSFFVVMTLIELIIGLVLNKNQETLKEPLDNKPPPKYRQFVINYNLEDLDFWSKIVFPISFLLVNLLFWIIV